MPSRAERQGVREPRDLSKYDTWKKYVIGTRRKFAELEAIGGVQLGGNRYFFEEATWPKAKDGKAPKITAQVQPDFGTIDDDGAYLWSVVWDFPSGEWKDHGKLAGRSIAKARCLELVREGWQAAMKRRDASAAAFAEAARQPAFFDDVPE